MGPAHTEVGLMLDVHSPPGGALRKSPAADTTIDPLSGAGTAGAETPGGQEGQADAVGSAIPACVSMPRLLLAFLKLGSISIGGRSASYLQDELVDRLHWLRREDWLEGHLLGRVLPGPSGVANAMFMA